MTVRLSVRTAVWRSQIAKFVTGVDGLVPVVKGNGYGFGRLRLAEMAAEFADTVAVGNVHELDGLPADLDVVVLTPLGVGLVDDDALRGVIDHHGPVLTVGSSSHLDALGAWHGRVVVKATTGMRRFGRDAASTTELIDDARTRGHDVVGVSVHPPIAGDPAERLADVAALMESIEPGLTFWLSHLDLDAYRSLPGDRPTRLRVGTALWHGDKSALHLDADVLDVRSVATGESAGYHQAAVPADGHLVMIGAGTANGVAPLADGRSPFHFERTRLALHESPHMHVSMAFVPDGDPTPRIGDHVDVQRALHMTTVDRYRWL